MGVRPHTGRAGQFTAPPAPREKVDGHMQKQPRGGAKHDGVERIARGRVDQPNGDRSDADRRGGREQKQYGGPSSPEPSGRGVPGRALVGHDGKTEDGPEGRHRRVNRPDDETGPQRMHRQHPDDRNRRGLPLGRLGGKAGMNREPTDDSERDAKPPAPPTTRRATRHLAPGRERHS